MAWSFAVILYWTIYQRPRKRKSKKEKKTQQSNVDLLRNEERVKPKEPQKSWKHISAKLSFKYERKDLIFFFWTDFAIFLWKWALRKYSFALFEFSILGILTTVEHYYSLAVKNQQIKIVLCSRIVVCKPQLRLVMLLNFRIFNLVKNWICMCNKRTSRNFPNNSYIAY